VGENVQVLLWGMKYVGHNGMMKLVEGHIMSFKPMPSAVVVEPSSWVIAFGDSVYVVKWLMLFVMKHLAPPSLCSSYVSIGVKIDGDAVASQDVNCR